MNVLSRVNPFFFLILLIFSPSSIRGQEPFFQEEFDTYLSLTYAPSWKIASIPQKQPELFPEATSTDGCTAGYNRAWLSWFIIDPIFYGNFRPPNVTLGDLSEHDVRQVYSYEIRAAQFGWEPESRYLNVLNLVYDPTRRGPYNYDAHDQPLYAAGVAHDGQLMAPESRWAGIMVGVSALELFVKRDVRYIEFWLMDPFINNQECGGTLYLNFGNISEDIIPDSLPFNESALPASGNQNDITWSSWGCVPTPTNGQNVFDNLWDRDYPQMQDVGFDGLADASEVIFFDEYLQKLAQLHGDTSQAYLQATADPSSDNYHYFRGDDYDWSLYYANILRKYEQYNGMEENSFTPPTVFPTHATRYPDNEDINFDGESNREENYFQYKIPLHPDQMTAGKNFIKEVRFAQMFLPNQTQGKVKWYQFRIPLNEYEKVVGDIQDFSSAKFVRLFLKDFHQPVVLRFATLGFVEINKNPKNLEINIVPNPAKHFIRLRFPKPNKQGMMIHIYDNLGRLVFQEKYPLAVYREIDIDASTFEPGFYIMRLSNERYEYSTKFIVAK